MGQRSNWSSYKYQLFFISPKTLASPLNSLEQLFVVRINNGQQQSQRLRQRHRRQGCRFRQLFLHLWLPLPPEGDALRPRPNGCLLQCNFREQKPIQRKGNNFFLYESLNRTVWCRIVIFLLGGFVRFLLIVVQLILQVNCLFIIIYRLYASFFS